MSKVTGLQKNIGDRLRRLDASDITKIILSVVLILFLAAVYHRSGAPDVPMDSVESAQYRCHAGDGEMVLFHLPLAQLRRAKAKVQ